MDDKMAAIAGGIAAVALAGRGLRPMAKLAMRGAVAVADGSAGLRRELGQLYEEAKAEQRGPVQPGGAVAASRSEAPHA